MPLGDSFCSPEGLHQFEGVWPNRRSLELGDSMENQGEWRVQFDDREWSFPCLEEVESEVRAFRLPIDALVFPPGEEKGTRADKLEATKSIFEEQRKDPNHQQMPPIRSLSDARGLAKVSAGASIFSAVVTMLLVFFGDGKIVDSLALIDCGILLILAWGTYKMWRSAAVGALLLFLISKIMLLVTLGQSGNLHIGMAFSMVIFLVMYINGVRGTFAYHRILQRYAEQDRHREAGVKLIQT